MSSEKWRPFCLGLNVLKPGHNVSIWAPFTNMDNLSMDK